LTAPRASTAALANDEDFVDLVPRHRADCGIGVQVVSERDQTVEAWYLSREA
jgi:hypothetical protein